MRSHISGIRRAHFFGLGSIALLLIIGHILTRMASADLNAEIALVNAAGQQRLRAMSIALEVDRIAQGEDRAEPLRQLIDESQAAHQQLASHEGNSSTVRTLLDEIEEQRRALCEEAERYLGPPSERPANTTRTVVLAESFLPLMNAVVKRYEGDAQRELERRAAVEFWLTIALIGALILEAIFLFEPVLRILRRRMKEIEEAEMTTSAAADRLRESEARYALAVEGSRDGLWDWDLVANEIYFAPRWCELLGLEFGAVGNSPEEWFSRIAPDELAAFRTRLAKHIEGESECLDIPIDMLHADGSTRSMLCRASAIRDHDGRAIRVAGSLADITDLRRAQEELRSMALHDRLTGLPNRQLFTDRLRQAVSRARAEKDYRFAVLFFDFDRFKIVNDSLGHKVGDRLLLSIAARFRTEIRDRDVAARFGGDEFVLLLDGIEGVEEAEQACERLLEVFAQPHDLEGHQVVSTASIGLFCIKVGSRSAEDVIRDADAAMYRAKALGKARYHAFDEAMHAEVLDRLTLEQELRQAVLRHEFQIEYQPIVDNHSGKTAGFEALVRWQHPERGRIRPDHFLPIAEETGLIVEIGDWIMRTCCEQLAAWREAGLVEDDLFVNVNLSRRQLVHPGLLDQLTEALAATGLEPRMIKLEITETVVMDDRHDMVPTMQAIRDLGFPLAMDDFGTGYSSLSCLHAFPIDVLKIDRSFTTNMETQREFAAVMHAIVTLAHHLKLSVVVEGVETTAQLAQLQTMDCEYAQGYLFSKPLPAAEATALLEKQWAEDHPVTPALPVA